MKARLVHVGFMFPGVAKVRDLEPLFGALGDWVRYSQTGWLLWSDATVPEILATLETGIDDNDSMIITDVNPDSGLGGRLPEWVWIWMNSKLDRQAVIERDSPKEWAAIIPPPRKPLT